VDTASWANHAIVKEWWMSFIYLSGVRRKSLVSLIMLVSWEVWNERNTRVFRNVATLPTLVVSKIRGEAALWSLAGAKKHGFNNAARVIVLFTELGSVCKNF
jgi:hypothetical protein